MFGFVVLHFMTKNASYEGIVKVMATETKDRVGKQIWLKLNVVLGCGPWSYRHGKQALRGTREVWLLVLAY